MLKAEMQGAPRLRRESGGCPPDASEDTGCGARASGHCRPCTAKPLRSHYARSRTASRPSSDARLEIASHHSPQRPSRNSTRSGRQLPPDSPRATKGATMMTAVYLNSLRALRLCGDSHRGCAPMRSVPPSSDPPACGSIKTSHPDQLRGQSKKIAPEKKRGSIKTARMARPPGQAPGRLGFRSPLYRLSPEPCAKQLIR